MTRRSCHGFTLVEVLVAMTIMAVMAAMAWQGVDGIVRARNASQARLEQTLRLSTVIAQWDQDLASVQDGDVMRPTPIKCDGATVRLTRRTADGLQIVAWSFRPDDTGTGSWVRWAGPPVKTFGELQDSWLRSQQLQGAEPGSLKTLSGLTGWQVYFFQTGGGWANCQSTGNAAAPSIPNAASAVPAKIDPPAGVRIVLSFAPGSGLSGDLTRDTLVSAR
jgi:general secretion pathway protein J